MSTKTQNPQPPPALTFPAPLYAALSPHSFLQAHLSTSTTSSEKRQKSSSSSSALRANGRSPTEFRAPGVNTGSLTHCHGSAVVRIGNTAVVCGVRGEILLAEGEGEELEDSEEEKEDGGEDAVQRLGLLVPNVELSTGSTPQHLPGNAPSQLAQTMVSRLRNLLLSTRVVRARDLRIVHEETLREEDEENASTGSSSSRKLIKAYWTLYIDTLFISLDGTHSAFDAAFLAILAALRDTKLPRAYWDGDAETILCDDDLSQCRNVKLHALPVPSSFGVLESSSDDDDDDVSGRVVAGGDEQQKKRKGWILSDPDAFEESVCAESICVVVDASQSGGSAKGSVIRKIEKSGGGKAGLVDREVVKTLVKRSVERWQVWKDVLERVG